MAVLQLPVLGSAEILKETLKPRHRQPGLDIHLRDPHIFDLLIKPGYF